MATKGMIEFRANGEDYTINDPNIAEEFDPTKAYHEHDHVYYQGNLYVFVAEHAAGAWNTSHVLLIKVDAELANLWNANATEATLRANADNDLKSAIAQLGEDVYDVGDEIAASTDHYYTGYKLTNDGYRVSDANYKISEFRVFAGDILKIVSDDKFQFGTSYIVNASGDNNRVGPTYGAGTFFVKVPSTAAYCIASTPSNSTVVKVYKCEAYSDELQTEITKTNADIASFRNDMDKITGVTKVEYIAGKYVSTINNPLTMEDGVPVTSGASPAWKCAILSCAEGDVFVINGASDNYTLKAWHFAKSDGTAISQATNPFDVNNNLVLVAPANAAWLILNSNNLSRGSYIGNFIPNQLADIETKVNTEIADRTYNDSLLLSSFPTLINPIEITEKTIADLQIGNGNVVATSTVRKSVICKIVPNAYIRITKIQTSYSVIGFSTDYPANGVVLNNAYSRNGVVNTDFGLQAGSNDHYMICMYYDTNDTHTAAEIEASMRIYYDCSEYGQFEMLAHAGSHMINLLKYRPVGKVSKPYIAISCDDGNAVLATYTIPRIQYWKQTYGIDIPVTFALFDASDVMLNSTYKELVVEACEDYGCAIAIHGTQSFGVYGTRKELMKYIKRQDDFLYAETGVKPNSVIYPEHYYNDFIQTLCGSYYNACGCGGTIHNYTYADASSRYFYVGEKSNCYEIYRLAIHDTSITSLNDVEDIVDYAYDHNFIICPYFHDVDLGDSAPNSTFLRSVLDKFVSYGMSKGIDFVKLGDIPYLL